MAKRGYEVKRRLLPLGLLMAVGLAGCGHAEASRPEVGPIEQCSPQERTVTVIGSMIVDKAAQDQILHDQIPTEAQKLKDNIKDKPDLTREVVNPVGEAGDMPDAMIKTDSMMRRLLGMPQSSDGSADINVDTTLPEGVFRFDVAVISECPTTQGGIVKA